LSTKKKTAKFYDSPLNKQLRKLMDEGQIRTDDLAKALSVTVEAVRLWCAGYARPDIEKLPVISEFFGVSTDYLLGLSEYKNEAAKIEFEGVWGERLPIINALPIPDKDMVGQLIDDLLELENSRILKPRIIYSMRFIIQFIRDAHRVLMHSKPNDNDALAEFFRNKHHCDAQYSNHIWGFLVDGFIEEPPPH